MTAAPTTRVALGAAALFATTVCADVPQYFDFEIQARSNIADGYNLPAFSSFNSKTPALNDDATIAFTLNAIGGVGDSGLFIGANGTGTIVYNGGDLLLEDPSINATGYVAMERTDINSDGIYVYDPKTGMTTQVVPPMFTAATNATINDAGVIGYRAGSFGGQFYASYVDGVQTTYVGETGGIAFLFTAFFNNANQIGGKVRLGSTSGSAPDEIRVYESDGSFQTLAVDDDSDPLSPYTGFDNSIALNDQGHVAFIASLDGGGRGVFWTDGVETRTIALEGDPLVSDISFFRPALNESGLVAFRGLDGGGLDAVFVGDGTTLRRVIGEHDLVTIDLGVARIDQHDNSVTFGGAVAINAHGDIAFNATLTPADNDQIEWGSGMFIAYAEPIAGPGDADNDGDVDFDDLLVVLALWDHIGQTAGDLNGDELVDFADLLIVLSNWTV